MKIALRAALVCFFALVVAAALVWTCHGTYGLHVLFRHGGTYWLPVSADSSRLSASMRLALSSAPAAAPGDLAWQTIREGFEVGDLRAEVNGRAVDHIMLARIDPGRFRFVVRNASAGDKDLDQWMAEIGAALLVNGSYYSPYGEPDTPFLSDGHLLGPKSYEAKAGAFVSSPSFTGIRDLTREDWQTVFGAAENAMVSYPLLLSEGVSPVHSSSRWLANRSFVGEDQTGRIVIGTTTDAFFSLDRLARFLLDAPLGLTIALNLDGGPVACQGIAIDGYERRVYGRWEMQVVGDRGQLLTWPYGTIAMPIVLAVFPK
jgi:hypothetical protein